MEPVEPVVARIFVQSLWHVILVRRTPSHLVSTKRRDWTLKAFPDERSPGSREPFEYLSILLIKPPHAVITVPFRHINR